eukprot:scaffold7729_cov120-Isochrysis_galbana.AAC.7
MLSQINPPKRSVKQYVSTKYSRRTMEFAWTKVELTAKTSVDPWLSLMFVQAIARPDRRGSMSKARFVGITVAT